ncbi:family 3 putative carbohydrate esterase [Naviculisporaceae sp. PSN 640]
MLPGLSAVLLAFSMPLTSHGVAIRNPAVELRQEPAAAVPSGLPVAGNIPLRILPLGASITYGLKSSDGNGYRAVLRKNLTDLGIPVNFVGNERNGTMRDNENEGWPGLRIEQVKEKAALSVVKWKPNLVLINAGTNDGTQDFQVSTAGNRMKELLDLIWRDSPVATVVLSTLLPNQVPKTQANVDKINEQYRSLVTKLRSEGKRIVLAEMTGTNGPKLQNDFADDTHPNDAGYKKMAQIWYDAIVDAAKAGLLQRPQRVVGLPDDGNATA